MNGLMMQQPLLISTLVTHAERHHGSPLELMIKTTRSGSFDGENRWHDPTPTRSA